ncbi:hypothetical protein AOLI_G00215380 [Acnodon oligacanthus]
MRKLFLQTLQLVEALFSACFRNDSSSSCLSSPDRQHQTLDPRHVSSPGLLSSVGPEGGDCPSVTMAASGINRYMPNFVPCQASQRRAKESSGQSSSPYYW